MIVFVGASAFIFYVLFGYPFLLALWARAGTQPVKRNFIPRTVSILLPVHNGERWLDEKIRTIEELDYPHDLIETIVISNASTDRTVEIAGAHAGPRLKVIDLPIAGKAAALNAGLAAAQGEVLFLTDVRQTLAKNSLHNLIACFADPEVGVVSGELMIRKAESHGEANVSLYWKYEKLIRYRQSRLHSLPGATGAIYAMRRVLARPLPEGTLNDDMHLPLYAYFRGFRLIWDAAARAYDIPASLQIEFRRKVRTLAGVYQIIGHFPRLLFPGHPLWIHFVSHKLARLLLPYALLTVLIASFYLPKPLAAIALTCQGGFYGLAALDPMVPERSALKRISSPVRTFVVLVTAAFCAASILFVSPDRLWKPTR